MKNSAAVPDEFFDPVNIVLWVLPEAGVARAALTRYLSLGGLKRRANKIVTGC